MAPNTGQKARVQAIAARAPTDRIIVLDWYGRGRSGIVWRMMGSSADVNMTSKEWHVGVFGERKKLRKDSSSCEAVLTSRALAAGTATRMMADHFVSGATGVRFEDVVTRPMETCDKLYRSFGVCWSEDGKFEFTVKPYGAHRVADGGRRGQGVHPHRRRRSSHQIDPSGLRGERERLSDAERRAIWNLTEAGATQFGYTASSVLPGVT